MSWIRDETRVSRRDRKCWLCGLKIERGGKYIARTCAEEGEGIWTFGMHPECESICDYTSEDDWVTHEEYEFRSYYLEKEDDQSDGV